ncbi:hypothetical protein PG985_000088 [Apiospora marii]|uniref:uncharacterized protein n=1 Tax=Apiospora marii TaxID=335849 RepID=UPI00312E5572
MESGPLNPPLPVHNVEVSAGPVAAAKHALGRGGGARLALVEVEGLVDDGGAGLEVARVGLLQRDGVVAEEAAVRLLLLLLLLRDVVVVVVVVVSVVIGIAAADAYRGGGERGGREQEGQDGGQGELHVGPGSYVTYLGPLRPMPKDGLSGDAAQGSQITFTGEVSRQLQKPRSDPEATRSDSRKALVVEQAVVLVADRLAVVSPVGGVLDGYGAVAIAAVGDDPYRGKDAVTAHVAGNGDFAHDVRILGWVYVSATTAP